MNLTGFAARVMVVVLLVGAVAAVAWVWTHLGGVVWMLGAAALAAYLINPLVGRLQNRGMGRAGAIGAVFLLLLSACVLLGIALAPQVQRQGGQMAAQLHGFVDTGTRQLGALQRWAENELPAGLLEGRDLQADIGLRLRQALDSALAGLTRFAVALAGNFIYLFLGPVITFLLLFEGPAWRRQLVMAVPNPYFEPLHRFIVRLDGQLGAYIRGVLLVALCVGSVATVGLWLCGMKYFFVVGPIMGLLNIIPLFGPLVGMGLAALVMMLQTGDLGSVAGPIVVGGIAQMLDNVLFTPVAVSRSVDLPPLLVLGATLVGGELFGLVGLLLAVPLVATAKVFIQALAEARRSQRLANWEEPVA